MKSVKDVQIEIGLRLEKLRKEKGFTSYEHFANEYNLSRMHYWKIEKGKSNITIKTLVNLLNIFEISIENFFEIPVAKNDNKNSNK